MSSNLQALSPKAHPAPLNSYKKDNQMTEIVNYFGMGGLIALFLCVFIEITPIKINPIGWLGSRLTKSINDKVDNINKKLDEHIVQSYRNTILRFQDDLLAGNDLKALEEWASVIEACDKYEAYVISNNISNGVVRQAMQYIRHEYQTALVKHYFQGIPGGSN